MDDIPHPSAPEATERVHRMDRSHGEATLVELRGDIDLLTAPALADRLDALTAGRRPDVVIDLRAVNFIDCSGLRVLCRVRSRALERRGRLRLISDSPRFLMILRHVRLADVFEIHPGLP